MLRLFVGIAFPEHVRLRLAELCHGLPGAKWIPPENMHLTVRFIGEVGGAQAEDINMALGHISAPAFQLIISGIDCFESGGKVHTLWAGIDKQPFLLHLYGKVDSALVRAGCEPERRKFKPHVTLARFRGSGGSRIGSFIQAYNSMAIGPFLVDRFTLFRSHLGNVKAHYEELADYRLETRLRNPQPAVTKAVQADRDE